MQARRPVKWRRRRNIHEATLFRKYGSKVGLIERAIQHQLSTAPISKVAYTGDLQADLYAILDAYVATNEEYGAILPVIFLEIPRYPELKNVLQTPLANIQGIVDIIARYQSQGLLKDESAADQCQCLTCPNTIKSNAPPGQYGFACACD